MKISSAGVLGNVGRFGLAGVATSGLVSGAARSEVPSIGDTCLNPALAHPGGRRVNNAETFSFARKRKHRNRVDCLIMLPLKPRTMILTNRVGATVNAQVGNVCYQKKGRLMGISSSA